MKINRKQPEKRKTNAATRSQEWSGAIFVFLVFLCPINDCYDFVTASLMVATCHVIGYQINDKPIKSQTRDYLMDLKTLNFDSAAMKFCQLLLIAQISVQNCNTVGIIKIKFTFITDSLYFFFFLITDSCSRSQNHETIPCVLPHSIF